MRELTGHKVNPANDVLKIEVIDDIGAGGAHHRYDITGFDTKGNPSAEATHGSFKGFRADFSRAVILFQNGPIAEAGVNGITHEALLAILIDRMEAFQRGPYACAENADALMSLCNAQNALLSRTKKRMDRGVEGTHAA